METIRLPVGKQAAIDVDCIRIEEMHDQSVRLTGSALCRDTDDGDSVSIVDGLTFTTMEEAEAAGIAWAASVGVDQLYVSTGTRNSPLERLEIDGPL